MNNQKQEKPEQRKDIFVDPQHPYVGLYPFREEHKKYFYGRDREIKELSELIHKNVLTVLFGKSGMGKTSLLRAGLSPWIRRNYFFPIYLRINFNDSKHSPVKQAKEIIETKLKEWDPDIRSFEDKTLWEYFYGPGQSEALVRPLLIFDQFEEIFRSKVKHRAEVDEFVTEIADLIENRVPLSVQERWKGEGKNLVSLKRDSNIRVIFSLREEFLGRLEMFYPYIPEVRFSRYRVLEMKGEDAIKAVQEPAKEILKDERVAVEIIERLPSSEQGDYQPHEKVDDSWKTRRIEPFLLSLFCYQANETRWSRREEFLTLELIREIDAKDLLHEYYMEKTEDFEPHVRIALEDLLVTDEGYKKWQDKNSILARNVTEEDISKLVDMRIVRREQRDNIDYIELIHDVLAKILKERRDKRKEAERVKEETARRKKRNRRIIIAVSSLVIVLMAGLIVNAYNQKKKAEEEKQNADKKAEEALKAEEKRKFAANQGHVNELAAYSLKWLKDDPRLSFRLAEWAYNKDLDKKKNNVIYRLSLLSVFHEGKFYEEYVANKLKNFSNTTSEGVNFNAIFSPEGKHILTVTSKRIILWDWDGNSPVNSGKEHQLENPLEFRTSAAFSPDGKYVVSCTTSKPDKAVFLWDTSTNTFKLFSVGKGVNSVTFSPDMGTGDKRGKYIIVAVSAKNTILLINLNGSLMKELDEGHEDYVHSIAASPGCLDKKLIVTAGLDGTVKVWDLNAEKKWKQFKDNSNGFFTAAFSPEGQRIIIGDAVGNVRLWNYESEKNEIQLIGEKVEKKYGIMSAVFSPDGQYVLTGSVDNKVRLLAVTNFPLFEFRGVKNMVHTVSFSPDGRYILIAPAKGPPLLKPAAPGEIIRLISDTKKYKSLSAEEENTYDKKTVKTSSLR